MAGATDSKTVCGYVSRLLKQCDKNCIVGEGLPRCAKHRGKPGHEPCPICGTAFNLRNSLAACHKCHAKAAARVATSGLSVAESRAVPRSVYAALPAETLDELARAHLAGCTYDECPLCTDIRATGHIPTGEHDSACTDTDCGSCAVSGN